MQDIKKKVLRLMIVKIKHCLNKYDDSSLKNRNLSHMSGVKTAMVVIIGIHTGVFASKPYSAASVFVGNLPKISSL